MGKEFLTFEDIEIEKRNYTTIRFQFFCGGGGRCRY